MTQRYAHHYPESLRDGVDTLDRIRKRTKIAQFAYRKVSEMTNLLKSLEPTDGFEPPTR